MSDQPLLNLSLRATRSEIGAIDAPQIVYLLLNIQAPEAHQFERMPLNLCLVIDRSTSMRNERMDRVKAAAGLVIDQLTNDDSIALVAFSDRAEVIAPAGPPKNVAALRTAIRGITPNGGTEIFQGLLAGAKEMRKLASDRKINQMILLTDGHTYGDANNCLELAEKLVKENIGLSAFGIGNEWNDQFLDQLVAPSGGQSAYIERPGEILRNLQSRIQGLEAHYAQNVSLVLHFPAGVELRNAFKLSPFAQPLVIQPTQIKLGAVERHTSLTALLEFVIQPQLPGRKVQIPLTLKASIPSQVLSEHEFKLAHELAVTLEEPALDPPLDLVAAVQAYNLYNINEKVWDDVESGHVDSAIVRLRRLTTRLLESGQTELAEQAYAETELLSRMGSLSLEGRKRLKYGTRSLMTRTAKLGNHG
jgi:Ca-activated chloride channel homolog